MFPWSGVAEWNRIESNQGKGARHARFAFYQFAYLLITAVKSSSLSKLPIIQLPIVNIIKSIIFVDYSHYSTIRSIYLPIYVSFNLPIT